MCVCVIFRAVLLTCQLKNLISFCNKYLALRRKKLHCVKFNGATTTTEDNNRLLPKSRKKLIKNGHKRVEIQKFEIPAIRRTQQLFA